MRKHIFIACLLASVSLASAQSLRIRTNILYDALATPTIGLEWLTGDHFALKLDGSYAFWGSEHGAVHKLWNINPELRWYLGAPDPKPNKVHGGFYLGVGGNVMKFNFYEFILGSFFPRDTGYQGWLWNAGAVAGYTLPLSARCAFDFTLGLGYNHVKYDSFTVTNRTRVYTDERRTQGTFGLTQASVNLIIKL
ncbi:MAG: DUF3575 domain-containing protein [Prevotellaceae bacterium]|jgi:hypothetical protein|nr:DUF3575 domain-containing protein [Prevotellaceae bacterium]